MPVYNERYTLREIVARVLAQTGKPGIADLELIVVDDCSTDGSRAIIEELAAVHPQIKPVFQAQNAGKGAAVRTGIRAATGEVILFQDADLEYDPNEYDRLLGPIGEGVADVVYGSRFMVATRRRVLYFWHSLMNGFLTTLSNVFTDLNLTDMETCYKVFRAPLLKSIPIRSDRFGIEPEITAKVAKRGFRIYEVPISYYGRTYEEGKKITWKDGVQALFLIFKYWLIDDCYLELSGHEILHSMSQTHRFNRWMADTIKPHLGDRVLEIGAGIGNLTARLLPREQYTTTDVDALHVDALRTRFGQNPCVSVARVDVTQAADFAALGERFDTVVCLNVLEHVEDDATAMRNLATAVRPGGRAVLLVPQGPQLYGSLDRVLGHCRRYTQPQFSELIRGAGLEIDELFDFNRAATPGWWFNGHILQREHFGKVQLKIYDSFVWLFRSIDRILPWRGASLIAVVRKPAA